MTEDVQLEVAELNGRLDELDDPRQGYALVKDYIERHQNAGDEIPEDLVRLEKCLLTECLAASQGR